MMRFVGLVAAGSLALACSGEVVEEDTATLGQGIDCVQNSGINRVKSQLALAAGAELGSWDPLVHFQKGTSVTLSPAGAAYCFAHSGCPNVTAYLSMQDDRLRNTISQSVFNPTSYREDLKASFDRQRNLDANLRQNNRGALAENHVLVAFGIPTNLGGCGLHYGYHVSKPDGSPLAKPANLVNRLAFFGYGGYGGNNPYIDFRIIGPDVYIDPPAD